MLLFGLRSAPTAYSDNGRLHSVNSEGITLSHLLAMAHMLHDQAGQVFVEVND